MLKWIESIYYESIFGIFALPKKNIYVYIFYFLKIENDSKMPKKKNLFLKNYISAFEALCIIKNQMT